MISSVYQDEPHDEPPAGMGQRTAVTLELRDYVVTKTAAKVWGSVMSTVFGLLVILGLIEAYVRTSPLIAVALVGTYGVYSERRVRAAARCSRAASRQLHFGAGSAPVHRPLC